MPHIDADKWRQRFRDPVWQFVGVLATVTTLVVSIVVAYDVFQKSQSNTQLTVSLTRKYPIISWYKDFDQEIEVYFRGEQTRSVSSFFFTMENTGKNAIRPDDYVRPIQLAIETAGQIATVGITSRQPGSIDLDVTKVSTRTFELSESLLNPGDKVEFQVILINEEDPWSDAALRQTSGRVVGVSDITVVDGNEAGLLSFVSRGRIPYRFSSIMLHALEASLLFVGILMILRRFHPAFWTSRFIEWRVMLFAVMAALTTGYLNNIFPFVRYAGADDWNLWRPAVLGFGTVIGLFWIIVGVIILRNRRSVAHTMKSE